MSTGISISSINRIKELAEEKKFEEALEILDTQNLEKSINPQFLRISGEIFRENKRYYDSRKILLKAHQMSPQGLRIIEELIRLYLELGYFPKAQRYYEQYLFYSTPEDTQKEYVEYIIKKGTGAEIKELASILIPILERLPEDRWNFEAVLLYDKLGRKDKALDESRYILENFKESVYVKPAIDYIEEKLDVDAYFYVYPKHEKEEDKELFGDLIDEEEKLLEADYLRMYPPEAKIMVEAEDKELMDIKPAKEKKSKKKKRTTSDETDFDKDVEKSTEKKASKKKKSTESVVGQADEELDTESEEIISEDKGQSGDAVEDESASLSEKTENSDAFSEEQIKEKREAALEKILSKKISTEQIKESAKQAAKAVKEIDTDKAKKQIKTVAKTMKGNVKKATDVLGEAVGVKSVETAEKEESETLKQSTEIVDGIIESVLEPPKKTVGEVVTNEELDALIPESLEAMSTTEIADLEAKKAEAERLELEAIEAQLKLEEEKKAKSRSKRASVTMDADIVPNINEADNRMVSVTGEEFTQLKEKFLAATTEEEDEAPLESLGFITVVQSDVDAKMEEEIPDTAGILHQMIDNKEFYAGEDSTSFESKASYENHGFEIENFAFEAFEEKNESTPTHAQLYDNSINEDEDIPTVEIIYAQKDVIDFSEMIPDEVDNFKQVDNLEQENNAVIDDGAVSDDRLTEFSNKTEEEPLRIDVPDENKPEDVQKMNGTETVVEQENDWAENVIQSELVWKESALEETETEQTESAITETETKQIELVITETETEQTESAITETEMKQTESTITKTETEQTVFALEKVEPEQTTEQTAIIEENVENAIGFEEMSESADGIAKTDKEVVSVIRDAEKNIDKSPVAEETESKGKVELNYTDRRQMLRIKILITENMTRKLMDLKESR